MLSVAGKSAANATTTAGFLEDAKVDGMPHGASHVEKLGCRS